MTESTTHAQPVSAFSLFTKSKDIVLKNIKVYGILFLLPFLISLISNIGADSDTKTVPYLGNFNVTPGKLGLVSIIAVITIAVFIITSVMEFALSLLAARGKEPTLNELWPFVSKFTWRFIGLSIVTGLLVVIGLFAFIVPGLIFIRRYFLSPYVMIDQDLSIGEAMTESARLSKPFSLSVWAIIGVMILLSLPGFVPVFGWLISIVLTSLYTAAPALRYLELKKLNPAK